MTMGKQRTRKLKRKNRWADVLAAIILVGVLVLSGFTLRDYMRSKALDFYNVHEGSIAVTLPGEMLVLRHEYLLTAPALGEFTPVAAEGERIKEGGIVGYCGSVDVTASKGGAVSYKLDGWEEKLRIDSLYELDWQQTFELVREESTVEPGTANEPVTPNLAAGRPVARLVDNLLDYKVILMLRDPRELLTDAQTISFTLPEGKHFNSEFSGQWKTPDGIIFYTLDISSKEDILFSLRYSEAEIIAKEVQGIIIPTTAVITDEQGKVGVYIQKKRKLVFTEIMELTSKDGFSVVSGLEKTAVVVTNPAKATDGQRIY